MSDDRRYSGVIVGGAGAGTHIAHSEPVWRHAALPPSAGLVLQASALDAVELQIQTYVWTPIYAHNRPPFAPELGFWRLDGQTEYEAIKDLCRGYRRP